MMYKKSIQYYLSLLVTLLFFAFVLLLYFRNITQDVYAGDIGDIATAAALFGVPHPPGYPTVTLLGFIFSKLPLPIPVISRIALVSLIASIGGLFIYFRFVMIAISNKSKDFWENVVNTSTAIISTGALGFSYYYWFYAEVPEVFALNHFFIIATYYAAYLFYKTKNIRYLYLTSLTVGLSMTNQQAIMFVFPGLFAMVMPELWRMVFRKNPKKRFSLVKGGISRFVSVFKNVILAFLIGLTPYLYVFISASTKPQINWLKEPTLYNFLRLLLRMDYSFGENLVDISQRIVVQQIYFSTLITNFSLVLVIIGVIGIIYLFLKNKRLFFALVIGFFISGPLFIFIITPEIIDPDELGIVERMFMQSFIIFSFFLPFGLIAIQKLFYKVAPRKIYGLVFLIPFFIVVGQMVYFNSPKTDLSTTKIGSNFVKDLLSPLPKNSVIFLLGDLGTLNTWYVHYVEGYRPDIILAGSFGDRNDYENKIYADFKNKNKKSKLSMEAVVIKQLPEILKTRKVYSMFQFPLGRKDYMWVPKGLVFELTKKSNIPDRDAYIREMREITKTYKIAYRDELLQSEQNNIAPYMSKQYANAFNHIGDFIYVRFGDLSSAYSYYSRAQIIDPQNPLTYAKLGIIQAEYPAQCNLAVENIDTSIEMYKIYRPYYTFALRIYKKCNVREDKINDLKVRYKKLFTKDLEKDPHY